MAQKLDIAFWSYDRTRLLADGSVKIEQICSETSASAVGLPSMASRVIRARNSSTSKRAVRNRACALISSGLRRGI